MKRECGTCTKCCEGWLTGEALGHNFYPGKPCHFLAINKGCTVYEKRPKDPCSSYKCAWLANEDIPEWMKPSEVNAIITEKQINGIPYLSVKETGSTLNSKVLTWLILYALKNTLNIYWQIDGGANWIGSKEFLEEMKKPPITTLSIVKK
jgi:hypothetical protein